MPNPRPARVVRQTPRILVIGDVMTDIIVKPAGPVARGTDTRAAIRQMPGGSAANQAAWLAHFGNEVALAARVGRDDHALQEQMLRASGVEPVLARDDALPTGMLVTLLGPDGERSFLTDRGANERLTRADLSDDLLGRFGHVHVSGYALFAEGPRAAVLDFVAAAARHGVPVTVDPGSAAFLREVGAPAFLAWTRGAAICFPNADEAATLSGAADIDGQAAALAAHYATVVIKRDRHGAVAATAGEARLVSVAAPRVRAIDATGAGDAFLAAFLTAYLRRRPMRDCLTRAVAAGAQATTHWGGRPPQKR